MYGASLERPRKTVGTNIAAGVCCWLAMTSEDKRAQYSRGKCTHTVSALLISCDLSEEMSPALNEEIHVARSLV